MGKDKFGTKRGRCALCDECYEYTPPADGIALACDYCDHKPIYHVEVVALGTCSCGKCHGYASNNEYQYTSCDYCDCSADKHINYAKVQVEVDKVKQRIKLGNAPPVVNSLETTTTAHVPFEKPPQTPPMMPHNGQYGLQIHSTGQPMETQSQGYTQTPSFQSPMPHGNYDSNPYTSPQAQPCPPTQYQYTPPQGQGQMPNQYVSNEAQFPMTPHPFNPLQQAQLMASQTSQYGMPPQFQNPQMYPGGGYSQAYQLSPSNYSPRGGMPYSPQGGSSSMGGTASRGPDTNQCKNPRCSRPKRKKENGSGHYDYCGKSCASSNS